MIIEAMVVVAMVVVTMVEGGIMMVETLPLLIKTMDGLEMISRQLSKQVYFTLFRLFNKN